MRQQPSPSRRPNMINFAKLPKTVRERIYRLHLVQDTPIPLGLLHLHSGGRTKEIEPLFLTTCPQIRKEASSIYFGENVFEFSNVNRVSFWAQKLRRDHMIMMRKLVVWAWSPRMIQEFSDDAFEDFDKLGPIDLLIVKVDERVALKEVFKKHPTIQWHHSLGDGPQVHLKMFWAPGILKLRGLEKVRRIEFAHPSQERSAIALRSTIPGGVLESIKREMNASRVKRRPRRGHFRFLDLPAELRNVIYDHLLVFSGPTWPYAGAPSSAAPLLKNKIHHKKSSRPVPSSALDILLVNRQINAEAHKIFYNQNDLVFSLPLHLQSFLVNLESDRLASLRNIALVYEEHDNNKAGIYAMDVTLNLMRSLNLRKFHLLLPECMMRFRYQGPKYNYGNYAFMQGAKTLFSLRNIEDIRLRDPGLEDLPTAPHLDPHRRQHEPGQEAQLRHFNKGLQLAQKGLVVKELYTDKDWIGAKVWPVLEGSKCGPATGCLCGRIEKDVDEDVGGSGKLSG